MDAVSKGFSWEFNIGIESRQFQSISANLLDHKIILSISSDTVLLCRSKVAVRIRPIGLEVKKEDSSHSQISQYSIILDIDG